MSLNKLSKGWGKNRNTVPLKNTLVHIAASKLTKNDIMTLLQLNLINKMNISNNMMRAIEHREKNLKNAKLKSFMVNYHRKKATKRKNSARHLRRN